MGSWTHKMISTDIAAGTGVCQACGPVDLGWRTVRGKKSPRCGIAIAAQKSSKGRHRPGMGGYYARPESHGLTGVEAIEFRNGKVCAICGSSENLHVDHCHTTGKIRDVLCRECNIGLGHFRDRPDLLLLAIEYLRKHTKAA